MAGQERQEVRVEMVPAKMEKQARPVVRRLVEVEKKQVPVVAVVRERLDQAVIARKEAAAVGDPTPVLVEAAEQEVREQEVSQIKL